MKVSFRRRIMTTIYLVAAVCVIIIAVVSYYDTKATIQENYVQQVEEKMTLLTQSFDHTMQEMYQATQYISCLPEIRNCIKTYLNSEQNYANGAEVSKVLLENKTFDSFESTLYLYLPECGKIFSSQEYYTVRAADSKNRELWKLTAENPFVPLCFVNRIMQSSHRAFAYTQEIVDSRGNIMGYIGLAVDERELYYGLFDYVNHTEENYMLISADGTICSARNLSYLGQQVKDTILKQDQRINVEESDSGVLYSSLEAPFTKYRILCISDLAVLMQDVKQHTIYMILFIILIFMGLIFITQLAASQLYRPVKVLHNEKEEAEINALQYQIRPHFMYNTLNSIRFAASLQKNDKLADMLGDFIALLEASTQRKGAFILLKEEIELVKHYLSLQSFRYFECFETNIQVDEETMECYVPCLLLQPIVENAVFHGIDPTRNDNRLDITAKIEQQKLHIMIRDNGKGFPVKEVEEEDSQDKRRLTGIGMKNVLQRLKLYYGDSASLNINSRLGEGTSVEFQLPVSYDPDEYSIRKSEYI